MYWDANAESYEAYDPLLGGKGLTDTTYNFEGYLIYQYQDETGANPQLLATYDIANGVGKVLDYQSVQGENVLLPIVNGSDAGLRRSLEISIDQLTNQQLNNGSPYYFGVVAYAYCPNGSPKILMTTHKPITIIPQSLSVGESFSYNSGDFISVTKNSSSDCVVAVKVVDPDALTGHDYEVFMTGTTSALKWNLRNKTTGDTLLHNQAFEVINNSSYVASGFDFSLNSKVIDGFYIKVGNPSGTDKIKEVAMVKDGGKNVTPVGNIAPLVPRSGINVFGSSTTTNSRSWWLAAIAGGVSSIQNLNLNAGEDDYEIRFTDTSNGDNGGSGFYTFSNKSPLKTIITKQNPVGYNRVPLQAWNITKNKRMYIKVFDTLALGAGQRDPITGKGVIDSIWSGSYINKQRLVQDSAIYEEMYFWQDTASYTDPVLGMPNCRTTDKNTEYPISSLTIATHLLGSLPTPGTIVRINTWKPVKPSDVFSFTATKPKKNDAALGKSTMDRISVFPNPYFGAHSLERDKYSRWVRFTNLPNTAIIRLYTVAGVFVKRIDKNSTSPFVDWNLLNEDNIPVASGMFLAYIEIPGIGTKVLKIAIIQETPYIDRL